MSVIRAMAIVVGYDGGDDLIRCIRAIVATCYRPLELVVVDNGATDIGRLRLIDTADVPVRFVRPGRNLGFAGGVNAGIATLSTAAPDDIYVLVNQDCFIERGSIGALVGALIRDPRIAVVGARLLAPDGLTVEHAGGMIRPNGLTEHLGRGCPNSGLFSRPSDVEYVTGALCAFRHATWLELGPFEAAYHPVYFEEVDFCVRARRAGLRVVYEPAATAVHAEATASGGAGSSTFLRHYHRNRMRFLVRHRLRRGTFARTIAAELYWLAGLRRLREIAPVLRAYCGLPADLVWSRRTATRRAG